VLEPGTEEPFVGRERAVEILDGDAEVVNSARLHASDAIWSVCRYRAEAPLAVPSSGRSGFARASVGNDHSIRR
jgi:hypothetical protein